MPEFNIVSSRILAASISSTARPIITALVGSPVRRMKPTSNTSLAAVSIITEQHYICTQTDICRSTGACQAGAPGFSSLSPPRIASEHAEFVRFWKSAYAQFSRALREQKLLVKATQQQREHAGKLQVQLLELQGEATMQLDMRRQAKLESHRQYLAARQTAN